MTSRGKDAAAKTPNGQDFDSTVVPKSANDVRPRKLRKVLVIEDSDVDFRLVERALSAGSSGDVEYRTVHAAQLSQGLQCLSEDDFHVVLLDLHLPDSRGIETLKKVRQIARQVPIIVLTGIDDASLALNAVADGAADYLVKGNFDADLLTRSIGYARARHKTQQKLGRTLQRAQATRQNLRNVISRNVDGMIVVDERGNVQFSNQAAQKLFGCTKAELTAKLLELPLPAGEAVEVEISRSSGERIPIELRCVEVEWEDQSRYLLMLHDLSHHKRAEAHQAQLASIVDASEDAIISVDLQGMLLSWNTGAETLFGYLPTEAVGRHISMLWTADRSEEAAAILETIKCGESVSQLETVRIHKDGHCVDVSLTVSPIKNSAGDVVSIAGIMRDITDRKQAEEDHIERAKAEREINIARDLQQSLFPVHPPTVDGFDIAGAVFPAEKASGDYFDFIPMRSGDMGVVVADVCGHGLGPAMMMVQTQAYLRALVQVQDDLGDILTTIDRLLPDQVDTQRFVSLFFARLEPHAHRVQFVSAGHRGYLLDRDGGVTQLETSGTVLGVLKNQVFSDVTTVDLHPGDMILLPTDGFQESRDAELTLFGVERMLDVVHEQRDQPASEIIDELHRAACDWAHGHPQDDDMTVVVIKVESG